jgi:hypothetical protein
MPQKTTVDTSQTRPAAAPPQEIGSRPAKKKEAPHA